MSKILSIDVSQHQGKIDWGKVAKSGIKVAIIREGYRESIDERFLENVKGALANGIAVIVYHFIYTDNATIEGNAKSTVLNMQKANLNISKTFVFADLEYDTWTKNKMICTKNKCSLYTQQYIDCLKSLGVKNIGVYMNNDYYKNYYSSDIINKYPVWLADYEGELNYNCAIHQYTSKGKCDGIYSSGLDMDYILDSRIINNINIPKERGNNMTENELRSKVANWLTQFVGISEGSVGHKTILNTFNNSRLSTRYTMTVNDAWCATSVSSAFIANGLAGNAGSGSLFECCECSCYYMINKAIAQGIWIENDAYVPKMGDVILYDWDDNGIGDNVGCPDHVGIVYSVSGSTIRVIEGNMGNGTVGYRNIGVNSKYIRGFITPNYAKFSNSKITAATVNTSHVVSKPVSSENKSYVGKGIGTAVSLCAMNVRSGASTNYASYGVINKGTKVEVLETLSNGWYKIVWSGASCGYAYTSNTDKYYDYTPKTPVKKAVVNSTNKGLNKTKKFVGKVTADTLNVRSWAGTENPNIKSYPRLGLGNMIDVCDSVKDSKGNIWYYILIANKFYGFVHSDYIQKV